MIPIAVLLFAITTHPAVRAEALVGQLGGPSYARREKAGKELVALGRAAIAPLERGVRHPDPEVAARCRRLIPLAEVQAIRQRVAFLLETPRKPVPDDVPLARKLLAVTGDTHEARQVYVEIYVANSGVLQAIDRAGPQGSQVFWDWANKVLNPKDEPKGELFVPQSTETAPAPRPVLTRGDVALFWLLSADPAFKPPSGDAIAKHAYRFDRSPAARDAVAVNSSPLRRMLLARLAGPWNYENVSLAATCIQEAFKLAGDGNVKEARPLARKLALDKDEWHVVRAAALMTLMQIGEASDVQDLSALVADDTTLGSSKAGRTMLGDVALAACVTLSGRQLKDFGFKHADAGIAEGCADPLHFGFFEAKERTAAREKWRRFQDARSSVSGGKR